MTNRFELLADDGQGFRLYRCDGEALALVLYDPDTHQIMGADDV